MNRKSLKILSLILAMLMLLGIGAPVVRAEEAEGTKDIVNIAVTNTVNTLNPFLYDGTIVNTYAIGLQYLPMVELNADMTFQGLIAEEITTEDNLTFTIKINPDAKWSDGEDITSDDVIFTLLNLTSVGMGNLNTYIYASFEGFNEGGQLEDNTPLEDVPSIERVDEKTLKLTAMAPIPLNTFMSSYMRYLNPVPKHVFEGKSIEEMKTTDYFNKAEVVSGPYRAVEASLDQYVSYEAVENYWRGTPKIKSLNIKVLEGSAILAGLQSGEVDFVQPTMATVPVEDMEAIENLEGISTVYDKPLTNNLLFMNMESIPELEVRQAIQYAIDRPMLMENFINGKGEVTDGFVTSFSPYYDDSLEIAEFDAEKAKELVEASGFDKELKFIVNSGDPIFMNAVNVVVQQLKDVGINTKVQSMDIGSLLEAVNNHEYDLMAVQYTFAPIDPLLDIAWLAGSADGAVNWSQYASEEMNELLAAASEVKDGDTEGMIKALGDIDRLVQKDLPVISLYVQTPLGAVRENLENAVPSAYGFFNNVQEWSFGDAE